MKKNINQKIKNAIKTLGCTVTCYDSSSNLCSARAVIMPISDYNNQDIKNEFNIIGCIDTEKYLYIGTDSVRLDLMPKDTIIYAGDVQYTVLRSKRICFKNDTAYIKAVLQKHVTIT